MRAPRPRFLFYNLLRAFLFSLFSLFRLVCFLLLFFALLFPCSLSVFFLFLCLLCLFPLSCLVFLCFALISIIYIIIIINIYFVCVCTYTRARAHTYTRTHEEHSKTKRKKEGDQKGRPSCYPNKSKSNIKAVPILFPHVCLSRRVSAARLCVLYFLIRYASGDNGKPQIFKYGVSLNAPRLHTFGTAFCC